MVSSLIEASAPLKQPIAADKAMAASRKLQGHVPRRIRIASCGASIISWNVREIAMSDANQFAHNVGGEVPY